jgi:hypothetical protein
MSRDTHAYVTWKKNKKQKPITQRTKHRPSNFTPPGQKLDGDCLIPPSAKSEHRS